MALPFLQTEMIIFRQWSKTFFAVWTNILFVISILHFHLQRLENFTFPNFAINRKSYS